MRPDPQLAMRDALALGPGHCPPDLFAGPVDAVVRGLKAHANTFTHARHVALEEIYPRARAMMGAEAFHAAAQTHLDDPGVLRLPLARIGEGLAGRLSGEARDMAAVELAWLKSHGAAEAIAFDLGAIAGLAAGEVANAVIARHPATCLVMLDAASPLMWDDEALSDFAVLVTRPHAKVLLSGAGAAVAAMVRSLDRPQPLGDMLASDPASATALVTAGALSLSSEVSQ